MNKKPIGVFDSGVGGLTVVKEIMKLMPGEEIVYLGDTANLPYGDKSEEIVKQYSIANTKFLMKFGIKVLVIACNTASSVAFNYIKDHFRIPVVGVIEPAAKGAVNASKNGAIGVIGTNRTIKSGIFTDTLKHLSSSLTVYSKPCPLFVPLIEENFIDHEATRLIAREYLKEFGDKNIDTLILGCTHYPLIIPIISRLLPEVKLVDSACSTAKDLKAVLEENNMLNMNNNIPRHRFYATDISEKLNVLAKNILESILPEKEYLFEKVAL